MNVFLLHFYDNKSSKQEPNWASGKIGLLPVNSRHVTVLFEDDGAAFDEQARLVTSHLHSELLAIAHSLKSFVVVVPLAFWQVDLSQTTLPNRFHPLSSRYHASEFQKHSGAYRSGGNRDEQAVAPHPLVVDAVASGVVRKSKDQSF